MCVCVWTTLPKKMTTGPAVFSHPWRQPETEITSKSVGKVSIESMYPWASTTIKIMVDPMTG